VTAIRLVAEVSSNHSCRIERAHEFVACAAELGCLAVKFQQFRIDRLFAREALIARPELARRRDWELPEEFNAELAAHARELGIQYASTPFDLDAVDQLEPHVDFFKVASYQLLWLEFLRELGRTNKPVVLATGMADLAEIEGALIALEQGGATTITLLHCVSSYPTRHEDANLSAIATLRERFSLPVGWSDHSRSQAVVQRAVYRYRAALVELHLDLDGAGEEFEFGHCWLPDEVRDLSGEVSAEARCAVHLPMDGDGRKLPCEAEREERRWRSDPRDGLRPLLEVRRELRAEIDARQPRLPFPTEEEVA
jgi:N-acetylneuraminate synthase